MADDRLPKRAAESRKEVQDKTREANAEMGVLCSVRCEEGTRGRRLEEEDKRQGRVEKTIR